MNAHYPIKKPIDKQYQTPLLSRIYNDISYYSLGNASVPIIDFHSMMLKDLASTSRDGMHCFTFVDKMKIQMILNYLYNSGSFDSNFLLGESYRNRVYGVL